MGAAVLFGQQSGNPAQAGDRDLQTQFETMLDLSNRYREGSREFKVVPRDYLDAFMSNVSDSIATYTTQIEALEAQQAEQQARIDATSGEVADRDALIADLKDERDTVGLLGMQLDKGTYSIIMWSLVIGLLIALLVALGGTRIAAGNNSALKRERDKLAEELEQSRKSRLTVEQDLRRQLQDEINKRLP
ncbi:hypothetical protein GGR26_002776 [Lewinella marina]|uniref:Uncharacterized protein n=2 Tax=Neolewinella marina TaxID=438751 RepID=A0A2G0CCV3_9BACT|nr:hypothetical protein [Neolewinella marina]NJB86999.1 hypothetical protein [Neolewinella marina]PHK97808.1 hypothetical protein CGL56_13405 [Neolewinella marina]